MKLAVATRARVGFAIALAGVLGVLEAELCESVTLLQPHTFVIGTAIGCTGLLLLVLGAILERNTPKTEHPFAFFVSMRYWGMIWLLSTIGLSSYHALLHPRVIQAKARISVVVEEVKTQAVVTFPPLELEGLTLNGSRSSVMINGQVLFVGDSIGKVVLTSIDGQGVTVEMEGQTNVLEWKRQ